MKCKKCNSDILFKITSPICPTCENLKILPKAKALEVVRKQIDWFNKAFSDVLRTYNKERLVVWLLGEREKISTAFFVDKPMVQLDSLLAMNVLIKRVMKYGNDGGDKDANEENTKELIDLFTGFINVAERHHIINADFGFYNYIKDFDIDKLNFKDLMANFKILYSFEWQDILKTFSNHLVMQKSEGDKYFEKYHEEYEKIKENPPVPQTFTVKETISNLFPTIQSFFVALTKSDLYAKNFDLSELKDSYISPDKLISLLNTFKQKSELMSMRSKSEFIKTIGEKFRGRREKVILKKLVFSKSNPSTFPLFVEISDKILVSPYFTRLLLVYYYPIYYKDIFNDEIRKRGNDFENTDVPAKFQENGFKTFPPFKDKKKATLEIDGLAWKDGTLFVIECKVWDIKSYFEHKAIHLYRERDLKGIVDGKSYKTKKGILKEKDIPSLEKKVEFVKSNLEKYCPDNQEIKEIKGIIVIKSQPPIKSYKDIKIISYEEILEL